MSSFGYKSYSQKSEKPNVLFIAIDDLKPILGCYGDSIIKTPNIDRLAAMGTVFLNNYCQQAVCGPTRASLMTGKRPDYTKVWDLKTPMRNVNPDILSIPQYFASQGYSTQGLGKVYDPRDVDKDNDKPSWTVPYYKTDLKYYDSRFGEPANGRYQEPETKKILLQYFQEATDQGMKKSQANEYALKKLKPTTECIDAPDNAYNDGANALQAKDSLADLSKKNELASADVTARRSQIAGMNRSVNAYLNQLKNSNPNNVALQAQIAKASAQLNALNSTPISSSPASTQALQTQIDKVQKEIQTLSTDYAILSK
jgi:hypothetical protein